MTRTQVDLPDELYQALNHRSQTTGVSLSDLISHLLQDAMGNTPLETPPAPPTRTIGAAFAELRTLMQEENYTLEIPPRTNRPNHFETPHHQTDHQQPPGKRMIPK